MNYLAAVCVTAIKQSCNQDDVTAFVTLANNYCQFDQTEETVRDFFFSSFFFHKRDIDQCTPKPFHLHDLCHGLQSLLCGNLTVIQGKLISGFIEAVLEIFGPPECVKGCTAARMNARSMYFKQNNAVVLLLVRSFVFKHVSKCLKCLSIQKKMEKKNNVYPCTNHNVLLVNQPFNCVFVHF